MGELVMYHKSCVDGFAAAWSHWMNGGRDRDVEYVAISYGDEPPDIDGKDVHIVDFGFPASVILEMATLAKSITLLDHHKTNLEGLAPLMSDKLDERGAMIGGDGPLNIDIRFDMNRSGAGMAWDHYSTNGIDRRPWLVDYAEDRDLWTWKLPHSKEANAFIQALPMRGPEDFPRWKDVSSEGVGRACEIGRWLLKQRDGYVNMMVGMAREVSVSAGPKCLTCGGKDSSECDRCGGSGETTGSLSYDGIPCVNAPYWSCSELVSTLAKDKWFAMAFFQRGDGKFAYMLRSGGDFDVAELAKSYGGGGHKAAAGFISDHPIHDGWE